jgi:hypothetical protein
MEADGKGTVMAADGTKFTGEGWLLTAVIGSMISNTSSSSSAFAHMPIPNFTHHHTQLARPSAGPALL